VPPARGIFVASVALSDPHSKVVGVLALAFKICPAVGLAAGRLIV